MRESHCDLWAIQHVAYFLGVRCLRSRPLRMVSPGIFRICRQESSAQKNNQQKVGLDFHYRLTAANLDLQNYSDGRHRE